MREAWLQDLVADLLADHGVTGASVAVWDEGQVSTAAAGVAHAGTGQAVTESTVFQIGSITKVHTAVLTLQRVADGTWSLATPIGALVPELAGAGVLGELTVEQLLGHVSGLDGDLHLPDTGRGDDAVERYARSCLELGMLHDPGAHVSYNNAGFVLLGRALAVADTAPWEDVVRRRLLAPAGLEQTLTLPEEALLHPVAVGHFPGRDGQPFRVTAVWSLPRASNPTGGLVATAQDVACFAGLHLGSGSDVLTAEHAALMARPVEPTATGTTARGLGWERVAWPHGTVLSHDGANIGQCAALRVLPDQALAVAVLTNWARGPQFNAAVVAEVVRHRRGLAPPEVPVPSGDASLAPLVGTFRRLGVEQQVSVGPDGAGTLTTVAGGRTTTSHLTPLAPGAALVADRVFGPLRLDGVRGPGGGVDLLSLQGRVARRVASPPPGAR